MVEIPRDPAEAAQLLRQWADDPSIQHIRMFDTDLIRLADMLDPPMAAPASASAWDDEPPAQAPAPAGTAKACEICGVYPAPAEFCGFGACPNAVE